MWRQLFADFLDILEDAVILVDQNGFPYLWNKAATQLLPFPTNPINGVKDWVKKLQPLCSDNLTPCPVDEFPLSLALEGKTVRHKILHFPDLSGQHRDNLVISCQASPFYQQAKQTGCCLILKDVTTQTQDKNKQEDIYLFLTQILDHIPAVVYSKKSDGSYLYINRLYADVFQLDQNKILGKTDYDFFDPETADQFRKNDLLILNNHVYREIEERVPCPNGELHIYQSHKFPILNSQGKTHAMGGISINVTQKKKMEAELEEERQRTIHRAQLASLGEMASSIAHEINSPLAVIMTANTLIQRALEDMDQDGSGIFALTENIEKTVIRITKIVTGLMNLARNSHHENLAVTTPRAILDEVISLCSEKFKLHGIEIRIDSSNALWLREFKVRHVQLAQVFLNLFNNAFDALEQQKGPKWIGLEIHQDENFLEVRMFDSGPGIPAEFHEKIFFPFFTTKEVGRGTGLGLSLSRSVIEKHGGEFYLDPHSHSTCFVIRLPIKKRSSLSA